MVIATKGIPKGQYPDTGCVQAGVSSCLKCPLPQCKEEMTSYDYQRLERQREDRKKVLKIQRKGWSTAEAANHLGLTERTIWRIFKRTKDEGML